MRKKMRLRSESIVNTKDWLFRCKQIETYTKITYLGT